MTDPSSFNKRVTLQSEVLTPDAQGGSSKDWSDVATVWASVEPMAGKEAYTWGKLLEESTLVIKIRYRAGVVPKMRLKYGTRYFDISSVIDEHEAHRFLVLGCTERL